MFDRLNREEMIQSQCPKTDILKYSVYYQADSWFDKLQSFDLKTGSDAKLALVDLIEKVHIYRPQLYIKETLFGMFMDIVPALSLKRMETPVNKPVEEQK